MNLLDLIARQWHERPARTLFSIISVAIAVAVVLGTALVRSSVQEGNRTLAEIVEGRPALDIISSTGARIIPAAAPSLDNLPGVVGSFPIVSRAALARVHGHRLRSILVGLPLDPPAAWDLLPISAGRACKNSSEAIVSADLAKSFNAAVGDRLTFVTRRGPRSATIVGLVDARALGELAPAATLAMPLADVQQFFALDDQVDRIRVLLSSRDARPSVEAALTARLDDTMTLQVPGQQLQLADTVLRTTELALRFSGALSLAMAAFIILNTLRMNFGERRREVAVLRVLGATSGQIVNLHLLEGIGLGLLGSIVGIPFGLLLGRGLGPVMQRLLEIEIVPPQMPYGALALAIVLGPLVAGVAAIIPVLQSRNISAHEALGDAEPRRAERIPLWAFLLGAITLLLAMAAMLLVMTGRLRTDAAIPVGLLMLVAFIVVIPGVLAPVVRFSAWLLSRWLRLEGELAVEQLLQRPVRTGLTAGVLVVAISTGLGLGNAILNNVSEVRQWHRRWISGDVSLMDPSVIEGPATAADRRQLREQIASQSNVASVVEMRFLPARANGVPNCCIVRDFATGAELPWDVSAGDEAQTLPRLREGEIVVANMLAKKLKLRVGDTLRLELSGRAFSLRVAALVNDYALGGLTTYLDRSVANQMVELGPAAIYLVQARDGAPLGPLLENLEKLGAEIGLVVQSFPELRGLLDRLINSIVGALWGLLAIGFVVGGMAVANTLTMSVLEQTRELGLLRIVGMTRGQVRKLVFCESLLVGILGTTMGLLAGGITAVVIHLCNESLTGHSTPFAFSPLLVAANAVGCLLVTILAGWSPAERAARLDLVAQITYE